LKCEQTTTAYKPKTAVELGAVNEAHRIVFPVPKTDQGKEEQPSFFRRYWWAFLIFGWFYISKMAGGAMP
jgi:hypothetical protein